MVVTIEFMIPENVFISQPSHEFRSVISAWYFVKYLSMAYCQFINKVKWRRKNVNA